MIYIYLSTNNTLVLEFLLSTHMYAKGHGSKISDDLNKVPTQVLFCQEL